MIFSEQISQLPFGISCWQKMPKIPRTSRVLKNMFKGGVGNGLEGCVNEEAVTPDIRGRVQARGQQPPSGKSESGNPLYLDPLSR